MKANTLLVRYALGYLEVSDPGLVATDGRLEDSINLGDDVRSVEEATRIALAIIAKGGVEQFAVEAEYEETLGPSPYIDYLPGNAITVPDIDGTPTLTEVVSITVTTDDEGHPLVQPEFGVIDETPEKRAARTQRRSTPGALAGQFESLMPVSSGGTAGFAGSVPPVVPPVTAFLFATAYNSTATTVPSSASGHTTVPLTNFYKQTGEFTLSAGQLILPSAGVWLTVVSVTWDIARIGSVFVAAGGAIGWDERTVDGYDITYPTSVHFIYNFSAVGFSAASGEAITVFASQTSGADADVTVYVSKYLLSPVPL